VIAGYDEKDSQSVKAPSSSSPSFSSLPSTNAIKIAVPNEAFTEDLDPRVEELFRKKLTELQQQGYQVDFVDFPILQQAAPIYYLLISAEVTSNLSRFDGMRFGLQEDMFTADGQSAFSSLEEYYTKIRSAGF
jgi:aspartyl-tRNA(Asn)/glutamyl-tRNA(Gln) amidotransferase subunit A